MSFLLDTDICIYALRNRPPEVLRQLELVGPSAVAVSVITFLELRQGAERSQDPERTHAKLDWFLSPLTILTFDERAALVGAQVRADLQRRGTPIGDFDSLIAAHALALDRTLVTNNLREFSRVEGLRVENWLDS